MAQTAVYTWGSSSTNYGESGGGLQAGESSKPYLFDLVYESGTLLPSTPSGSVVIRNIAGGELIFIDSEWLPGLGPNPGVLIVENRDYGPLSPINTMLFDITPDAIPSGWSLTQITYTTRLSYTVPDNGSASANYPSSSDPLMNGLDSISYAPGNIDNILLTDAALGIWDITFTYQLIPEPSSLLMGSLGVLALCLRKRR